MSDIKIIFFHHNSKKLEKASHELVEDVLNDPFFYSSECALLGFVGPPVCYDRKDDEPRIEYLLGIGGRCKSIGFIFILERLLKLLKVKAVEKGRSFKQLHYTVLITASSFNSVHMSPFKRHFSAVDEYCLNQISFGNILHYTQFYCQRKIDVSEDISTTLKVNSRNLPRLAIERVISTHNINKRKSLSFDSGTGDSLINEQNNNQKQSSSFTAEESDEDNYILRARTPPPETLPLPEENFIIAEFEHDLRILSLRFLFPSSAKDKKWIVLNQIRLAIKYESIKQVHLELEKRTSDTFWARLYLRLKYPVQIWHTRDVFGLKDPRMPNNVDKRKHKGTRVRTWENDEDIAYDLANAPVIVLDFAEERPERLSAIIGRLMGLLKLDLELRNIEQRDIEEKPQVKYSSGMFYGWLRIVFERSFSKSDLPNEFFSDNELFYWIEALATRGFVVLDHWIDDDERNVFLKAVVNCYIENRERTLSALEMLSNRLLDRTEVRHRRSLTGIFQEIERFLARNDKEPERLQDGFVRLKKVIVTPSRIIPCGNEVLMGNRVVRIDPENYPTEKFLRIVFRDDDGSKIHQTSVGGPLIDNFIRERLRGGMSIGNRDFRLLGTSNSQMREGGCYFLQAELDQLVEFRKRLGLFDRMPTIPKMMSRLGLCFTQGKDTNVDMSLQMLGFDFLGGPNTNGENYIISDGCGCLSMAAARKIAEEIGLDSMYPPSCIQFRYAGYKGVLSINLNLDAAKKYYELSPCQTTETRESYMAVDFYFRPSQKKFDIQEEEERLCRFEVVKYSSPVPLFLNKPLINILDQVSKLHSTDSHGRICKRLHMLLDHHIFSLCATLTDEMRSRNRLSELPRYIQYDMLETIQFTQEPFFRLVLRAAGRVSLIKLRQKLAIAIPYNLGRVMFGVVDETDSLQYGQVFVQYSKEISFFDQRTNRRCGKKIIVTGPVLISKNPAIVGGDVRMFEAVDVPALHHLVDVLVFPRFGPRPHSDEMAGSDLDGDEYGVIWDPELAFDRNEPAADYTQVIDNEQNLNKFENDEDFQDKMAEFFVNYMKHDSIGRIANAHLACSDLYGIKIKVCYDIARKHQQAVDFPKTGKHPVPLEYNWRGYDPPERFERAPDFMDKESSEPQYLSNRLNGQLYRRVNQLNDFLSSVIVQESTNLPTADEYLLSSDNHSHYIEIAQVDYDLYSYRLKRLMEEYGINCEGELFSSSYSVLRNRLSDRETDDMSFFNTTYVIGQRLWEIVRLTRKKFFASGGGRIETLTDANGICVDPSERLRLLAKAYYTIAYFSSTRKFLSFPWIACWDVLDKVRRTAILKKGVTLLAIDPFADNLLNYINLYMRKYGEEFKNFCKRIYFTNYYETDEDYERKCFLYRYVKRHKGLDILLFFCCQWAKKQKIFELSPLREEHICLLVITSELFKGYFYQTPPDWTDSPQTPSIDISPMVGRRFLSFLELMSSLQFERSEIFDFRNFNLEYQHLFINGEWRILQKIALNTYLHLVFSDQYDHILPSTIEKTQQTNEEIQEGDCFQIELPSTTVNDNFVEYYKLLDLLCKESGCERIMMRCHPRYRIWRRRFSFNAQETPRAMRILVISWGIKESIVRLRQLLSIRPQMDLSINSRLAVKIIPEVTLELFNNLLDNENDSGIVEYLQSYNQYQEDIEAIDNTEEEVVEYYDDSE